MAAHRHASAIIASIAYTRVKDFLLKCTGDGREGVICVRTDQSDSANYEYKDYGKHHRIFRNILTLLVEEDVGEVFHLRGNSFHLKFVLAGHTSKERQTVCDASRNLSTCQH